MIKTGPVICSLANYNIMIIMIIIIIIITIITIITIVIIIINIVIIIIIIIITIISNNMMKYDDVVRCSLCFVFSPEISKLLTYKLHRAGLTYVSNS